MHFDNKEDNEELNSLSENCAIVSFNATFNNLLPHISEHLFLEGETFRRSYTMPVPQMKTWEHTVHSQCNKHYCELCIAAVGWYSTAGSVKFRRSYTMPGPQMKTWEHTVHSHCNKHYCELCIAAMGWYSTAGSVKFRRSYTMPGPQMKTWEHTVHSHCNKHYCELCIAAVGWYSTAGSVKFFIPLVGIWNCLNLFKNRATTFIQLQTELDDKAKQVNWGNETASKFKTLLSI